MATKDEFLNEMFRRREETGKTMDEVVDEAIAAGEWAPSEPLES
ncbi:hypothetical protein [Qingshengfaniella alkalisoli]|nr:hypothetical protein [Qingshengfaniella alkalisoli]